MSIKETTHIPKKNSLNTNTSSAELRVPLKSLIIVGDLYPNDLGGAEVHIVEVIRGLAKRGHELHVFVGESDDSKILFKEFKNVHLYTIKYPKIKNLYSLAYILWGTRAIKRFLKAHSIDLLHAKEVFPMGVMAAHLSKKFKKPLYITVQNPVGYKEELVLKGKWISSALGSWIKNGVKPLVKYALKRANITAPVSSYSAQRVQELVPSVHYEIVPNGVDTEKFYPDSKISKIYTICTTSTLIPRNGIDILIRSIHLLAQRMPEVTVAIAGEGPLKEKLVELVKELNLEKQVHFLGTVTHRKVPDLIRQSKLFVRPSRVEGFGVSFVEAMACGVPVVTCPSGGILDFVRDHETGRLVPKDNPDALAEAMAELLKSSKDYTRIAHNAQTLVKAKYSWESIVERVEELYYKIHLIKP